MRAANATKSTLQRALDDLEKAVEQLETAFKQGKGSSVYLTKMRESGKAPDRERLANVEKLTEDIQRDRPLLSCLWCNTLHA